MAVLLLVLTAVGIAVTGLGERRQNQAPEHPERLCRPEALGESSGWEWLLGYARTGGRNGQRAPAPYPRTKPSRLSRREGRGPGQAPRGAPTGDSH